MHLAHVFLCPMSLSARLIQLRRERGWTQPEVADQVGLHVNQVKRYEAGSSQPSLEGLKKLARVFSVSTDWLLFEDAERGPSEELKLQFEAVSQLPPEERHVARAVLDAMIVKHQVAGALERLARPAPPPPPPPEPAPRTRKTAASRRSQPASR